MTFDPCPVCEGSGLEPGQDAQRDVIHACLICAGTGRKPLTTYEAATRRAGRLAGIKRAQRRR